MGWAALSEMEAAAWEMAAAAAAAQAEMEAAAWETAAAASLTAWSPEAAISPPCKTAAAERQGIMHACNICKAW